MTIVHTGAPIGTGLTPLHTAANGRLTDGFNAVQVAQYVNMLTSRRFHVLAQVNNSIGSYLRTLNISGRFHTSPNVKKVEALLICGRSNSATAQGSYQFSINAYNHPILYVAGSTSGTPGPQDFAVVTTELFSAASTSLAGDTTYNWQLSGLSGSGSLLGVIIYEIPRDRLDTATDQVVAPSAFAVNAPILDRDMRSLVDVMYTAQKRQKTSVFNFHWVGVNPTAPSQTGGTFKNMLDSSTAGYSSAAAGYWAIPYRKNSLTRTTIDVVVWCVANLNPVGPAITDGEVRFTDANGTIATITGIGTSASMRTATATMSAASSASSLVIVEHRSPGSQIFTSAAGMYELT